MNILMMTNTYVPHVGGVARSVQTFTEGLRSRDHRVVVVAPEYDTELDDEDVIRVPAVQHFNGSDFSVVLPIPGFLDAHLSDFQPDLVHSHHPFLIGSTADRIAAKYQVPLVYTQHTLFEQYMHYVPMKVPRFREFIVNLSTGYANMCDQVIVPSESVEDLLRKRGVETDITVVPTGIDVKRFQQGTGKSIRKANKIPHDAFVIGHLGRLAPEKNLEFLCEAVSRVLASMPHAHFLVVGYGLSEDSMREFFDFRSVGDRVHFTGKLEGTDLADAYHAMDVFVFSSKSETQGLVLAEAMAAALPVIALDASGVREVVKDGYNGHLLKDENVHSFAQAVMNISRLGPDEKKRLHAGAGETAQRFSTKNSISKVIGIYEKLINENRRELPQRDGSFWRKSLEQIKAEWELLSNITVAAGEAIGKSPNKEQTFDG